MPSLLDILFWLNFVVGFIIPLLGTLYSRTCNEKWIFGWMVVLASNYTLNPALDYILSPEWSQVFQISFNSWFSIFFTQDQALYLVKKMRKITKQTCIYLGLNIQAMKMIGI